MGLLFLRLGAAPLQRMLYELCAMGCGYFLWGAAVARAAVPCCVLRRVHSLRRRSGQRFPSSGVRQWLFCDGRGIWLRQEGNLRDEPQARRQRLPAAAEACDVVLRARGQDSSISQLAEEQM